MAEISRKHQVRTASKQELSGVEQSREHGKYSSGKGHPPPQQGNGNHGANKWHRGNCARAARFKLLPSTQKAPHTHKSRPHMRMHINHAVHGVFNVIVGLARSENMLRITLKSTIQQDARRGQ
eukprot:355865-Amphidinium_carterae.1